MLFSSFEFMFVFLPIVFFIYFYLNRLQMVVASRIFLVLSSLFFYSWWNILYLPLLLSSLLFNYGLAKFIRKESRELKRRIALIIGISLNISVLAYYKYSDFFISNLNLLFSTKFSLLHLVLPLGISFITFQKIAYLVDVYKNETEEYGFLGFTFFVTFFPQLIAGPIVQHHEIIPQFTNKENQKLNYRNISLGIFIFVIGLFKKIVIADSFAAWASPGFDQANVLSFFEAWITSLSYTMQLYFDFSGYTDMAIGSALLFNIKLPINFNSPYKALDIQEFWRRWHITLSRFLTKYLYISLGGNRKGNIRTYINILIIFIVSGIWHGAGWNFVFWGFLHGTASVINRYWKTLNIKMNKFIAWFITFNFINLAWVFFRAKEWGDALKVLRGMFGLNGFILPQFLSRLQILSNYGLNFGNYYINNSTVIRVSVFILFALLIVSFSKNSYELIKSFNPGLKNAVFISLIFFVAIVTMFAVGKNSEFLYFNF